MPASPSAKTKQPPNRQLSMTARHRRQSLLRSIAIVGLACTTVSVMTYSYLHGHTLVVQDHHKISEKLAHLPVILGEGESSAKPSNPKMPQEAVEPPTAPEKPLETREEKPAEKPIKKEEVKLRDSQIPADNGDYPVSTSPYAYGFVIGGCDPGRQESYQNYLFNIAIAAKILKERGSTADVIALFQVSESAKTHELAQEDLRVLHSLGVYVFYIPQQTHGQQSFYRTQLDKFRILGMNQYQRILFLDGDVMPIANLDYLFEMSVNGTLQENVVLQGIHEPANGGFFMVKTGPLEAIQEVIAWRERTALELPYPYFDPVLGWGHAIEEEDPWRAKDSKGTNWTFLAAFADQGLLYYYTKYNQKSVSILMRNGDVENWGEQKGADGTVKVRLLNTLKKPFDHIDSHLLIEIPGRHKRYPYPTNSMIHFTGSSKPWLRGGPPEDCCHNSTMCCNTEKTRFKSDKHYWYWELSKIKEKLRLDSLDFSTHWKPKRGKNQRPPLGLYPVYAHVLNASSNILTPLQRVYPLTKEDYHAVQ